MSLLTFSSFSKSVNNNHSIKDKFQSEIVDNHNLFQTKAIV